MSVAEIHLDPPVPAALRAAVHHLEPPTSPSRVLCTPASRLATQRSRSSRCNGEAAPGGEQRSGGVASAKGLGIVQLGGPEDAAASLWFACVGAVNWEAATAPEPVGDDVYRATVRPALGEDSPRRFRGCLEDASLDKVRGDVERMETVRNVP
jgi:hypothetical protein